MDQRSDIEQSLTSRHHSYFAEHGNNYQGVGWTKSQELVNIRHRLMLDIVQPDKRVSLLDVGCGLGHTYEYLTANGFKNIDYVGIDLSEDFIEICSQTHPGVPFHRVSILDEDDPFELGTYDYAILSGLFTSRGDVSYDDYFAYCKRLLSRVASLTTKGFVFNATTKFVDWERDELFHLPIGDIVTHIATELSRHFVVRHDYGLFEYTVYVFHDPQDVL